LAAVVGRLSRTPIIIATRHNVDIGGKLREWINRWARKLCDMVITVSKEVYEAELERSGTVPSRVALIRNGVQVDDFAATERPHLEMTAREWDIDGNTTVIGTLARFHKQKGHSYLLEAMTRVQTQRPGTRALLVGDGPLRPEMEAKAGELDLSETVIFTGIRRDVPEILALLDVFVLPSLWEGLPVALLEAMAAGLPVVATRVGGVPEVVIDGVTGLLVPPRDPEALSETILRLLQDSDLRHRMGQAGQERVREHFSVDQMIRKTEALYERLLAEKELS
jgi:glycosyltransferase involved in cell wall biosynthesis